MKYCGLLIAVLPTLLMGCSPTTPSPTAATVRFTYLAATALNPDLPASVQACVQGVGRTHIHPSWRNFIRVDMQAVGSDRWEVSLSDVVVNERQSIRISDPNVCGVKELHFRDLRREFSCRLMESGARDHDVRDFLGHANITTTSRYLRSAPVRLAAALKQMEANSPQFAHAFESGRRSAA